MPRPLKSDGLIWSERKGWCARVFVTIDGERVRKTVELGTRDRVVARCKRARLLTGEHAPERGSAPLTVSEAAAGTFKRWEADGVSTAPERESMLRRYALGPACPVTCENKHAHVIAAEHHIGDRSVTSIAVADIEAILSAVRDAGMAKQSVAHMRFYLTSIFDDLRRRKIIASNPVADARSPRVKRTKKRRAVLSDEEIRQLLAHPTVDIEIKMLVLLCRTVGGQRAGDLNALRWSAFGEDFATCAVPRGKTDTPQVLIVPHIVRPFLGWWHAGQDFPNDGPVFPCRRGKRAGEPKKPGNMSYAARLRRELVKAGVDRYELHHETTATRPTDFHSIRRAYVTALGLANVNAQTAQLLAGHSDAHTHMRYYLPDVVALPDAAIPRIEFGRNVPNLPKPANESSTIPARPAGIEPATLGSEVGESDGIDKQVVESATVNEQTRNELSLTSNGCAENLPNVSAKPPGWTTAVVLAALALVEAAVSLPLGALDRIGVA